MKTFSKTFLILSIVLFGASLTDLGMSICFGLIRPLSAIFFVVFFISFVLEAEVAKFDAEHEARIAEADSRLQSGPASATESISGKLAHAVG